MLKSTHNQSHAPHATLKRNSKEASPLSDTFGYVDISLNISSFDNYPFYHIELKIKDTTGICSVVFTPWPTHVHLKIDSDGQL